MDIKTEQAIREVILAYFKGIFEGNDNQLEQVIHPNTILYGDILGTPYRKSRQEYIEGVRNRKSPKELGEIFNMEILSMEAYGNNAVVKASLQMLGHHYIDFLSLTVLAGQWIIVNKLFTEK